MTDRVNMHHGKDYTLTYKETYIQYKNLFNHVRYYCTDEENNVMLENMIKT